MKRNLFLAVLGASLLGFGGMASADPAKTFNAKCVTCHGKDGKGDTTMGKQKGAKDFATLKLSADDIAKVISDGKNNEAGKVASPAFKDKIPADEIKALADYVKATFIK